MSQSKLSMVWAEYKYIIYFGVGLSLFLIGINSIHHIFSVQERCKYSGASNMSDEWYSLTDGINGSIECCAKLIDYSKPTKWGGYESAYNCKPMPEGHLVELWFQ